MKKNGSMLRGLLDECNRRGWIIDSLAGFRMEEAGGAGGAGNEGGAGGAGGEGGAGGAGNEATPTLESLQAEVDKWKAHSRKNESDAKANRDAAKKLADLEAAQKTDQQKLEERATAAETALADSTLKSTRLHVALTKGLPAELAVRLQGATEEEMGEDADRLLELIKTNPTKKVDLGQGARGSTGGTDDMNARIRQAAGRA